MKKTKTKQQQKNREKKINKKKDNGDLTDKCKLT